MESNLEITDFGDSRLDGLVADFAAHVLRLQTLDVETTTSAQVLVELRDNAYPSLLALAEELRELDGEFAELSAPGTSLEPEHAIALAAALKAGSELTVAARAALPDIAAEAARTALEARLERFEKAVRVATAVLHQIVIVQDDFSSDASNELTE